MDKESPNAGYRKLTEIEMLTEVRALLSGKWTQGSNALDGRGLPTKPTSPDAVCYCLRGACIHVLRPSPTVLSTDLHVDNSHLSRMITHALGFTSSALLVQWNDTQGRTEDEVITRVNQRIRELKKERRHELPAYT